MATQIGESRWASITNPNTTFEPMYCINLIVEDKVAEDFKARGFTVKDMDDGPALVFKRKVTGSGGRPNEKPRLYDRSKNEIDLSVGNGSKVKVQYKEWEATHNGTLYKGLDLIAVQVLDLVSYNGAGDEFDIEESLAESDEL